MKELSIDQITRYIIAKAYYRIAVERERNDRVDITKRRKAEIAHTYEVLIDRNQMGRLLGTANVLEGRVRERFGSGAFRAARRDRSALRKAHEDFENRIVEASASGELLSVCIQLADDVAAEWQDHINLSGIWQRR